MEPSGQRRLADNLRSVLMSAAAHINASPDVPADEKNSLLSAWDVEYRGLTDITVRLERDEHRRILSGQLSKRQSENWDDFRSIRGPVTQLWSRAHLGCRSRALLAIGLPLDS